MRMSLSTLFGYRSTSPRSARRPVTRHFRPRLEGLEEREVLSAAPIAVPNLGPALLAPLAQTQQQTSSVLPLSITGVSIQNGQLVASGLLGNQSFSTPLSLTNAATSTATTPILSLRLDPIHLNLLGLTVDTSPICLNITAQSGPGKLLGNLLTDVSNLLNNGGTLGSILGGLSSTQQGTLTSGLSNLLNGALGAVNSTSSVSGVTTTATQNILHLSLGPVNLNLLGLNVKLDNCSNGPVTVDVGAQSGPGNLLGNLLGGVANLLNSGANTRAVTNALGRFTSALESQIVNSLPLSITGVSLQNGQLVANGLLGTQPFTAPITLSTAPTAAAGTATAAATPATPVLNLTLGPINLNLLGLTVATSPICLAITAQPGPGNLLGNLLSGIAGALNGGTPIGTILGGLTSAQQTTLTNGLGTLLNTALTDVLSAPPTITSTPTGNILHLSLGPVNLNLLGLNVKLDNCANGPVTVDIGAVPGPGNLLGNLLEGVTHLFDNIHNAQRLETIAANLVNAVEGLL